VCGAHHGALHRGALQICGKVSSGLRFLHADGTPYGHAPSALHSHVGAGVFGALRALGFSEKQSRQAVAQCLTTQDAGRDPGELLRAAIAAATH
jgi:Holliday junction resolvasome RuvABC DNA-binding subunit